MKRAALIDQIQLARETLEKLLPSFNRHPSGGATGHLLTTILNNYPGTRGILFDLPHVVRDAPVLIQARGLAERVTI